MPVNGKLTASDFTLQNVMSADQIAKLNMALEYLQQSPAASAVLHEAALTGVAIGFNPGGANGYPYPNNGTDGHSVPSNVILWNPDSALQMFDNAGNAVGVSSAASGLAHEMVHAIDPQQMANVLEQIPDYENLGEYVAITIEKVFNGELNEPTRDNHNGLPVITENPTTHTNAATGNWEQMGSNGQVETGPQYEYGQRGGNYAPEFGSTDTGSGSPGNGNDPYDGSYDDPNYGGDGGGRGGCVAITSFLPDSRIAGQVKVGDTMELAHEETLEAGTGVVSYSQTKDARGYRITTETGASLVCSDTAPIPARGKGLLTPDKLLGAHVAVRWDEDGMIVGRWEIVTKVEEVGLIKVQHITVGDKCFWAGEKKGAYILHHNMKDAGSGGDGGDFWPEEWDPLKVNPKQDDSHLTTHHNNHGGDAAILVGVPHAPPVDGIGFM